MKRKKPLSRGAPPRRRRALKSKAPLRRTPLTSRPRPRTSELERRAQESWWMATLARAASKRNGRTLVCPVCGETKPLDRMQAHHVIEQSKIRAYVRDTFGSLDAAQRRIRLIGLLWDNRNGLPVCTFCHARHTARTHPIPRRCLDQGHRQFAHELQLSSFLDRTYR